ncbi:MAG: hypothetical protein O6939_09785 [Bacteroidetes bacterium]|nr:hypothetical protein [Bacteroidota bacterium]
MRYKKSFFLALLILTFEAHAQFNWPEDRATAEEKNAFYTDNMKSGNYKATIPSLRWLMNNAPDLNPSIYINGAKIYEGLADAEKDPKQKIIYADSALIMYDLRIKNFNDEAKVLNRKAFKAYKYQKGRKEKYQELFELFQRTFELNGNNLLDNNIVAYMDVVRRYKLANNPITDAEIINIYSEISDVIDYKITLGKNVDRLQKYQDNVDKLLTATVTVDCDFVENNLGPKLESDPSNLKMAKKIFQLLLTGKCSDSPLFIKAAKSVHNMEPSYGLAIVVAKKEISGGSFEEGVKYYNEALELTDDNTKKGEIYFDLATVYAAKGEKRTSRSFALQSVGADPTRKDAYSLVGNLYMTSYNDCREGVSKVADRGVFLAAFEMFKRAGDSKGMNNARNQFPSIEEIFELDLKEGDTIQVGCWINGTVAIQRRPS